MWNLIRNDTNELFKNRNRLIALENELMAAKKEGWGEGIIREFGMDTSERFTAAQVTSWRE